MMITRHGAASAPDGQSCTEPLASHIERIAAQLSLKGYAQNTVRSKCDMLADLSRWLVRRGRPVSALDESRLRQFHAARRRQGKTQRGDPATGQQLIEYLRDRNEIVVAAQRIDLSPAGSLAREFEEFLLTERGLARPIVVSYLPIVRCFLEERFGRKTLRLVQLRTQDLHGFILRQIQRVSRSHGKRTITALRSFLRFFGRRQPAWRYSDQTWPVRYLEWRTGDCLICPSRFLLSRLSDCSRVAIAVHRRASATTRSC